MINSTTNSTNQPLLIYAATTVVAGGVFLYAYPPDQYEYFVFCPFFKITQFHCAGCGATRACYSLITGDFCQALAYNIVFTLTLFLFVGFQLTKLLLRVIRVRFTLKVWTSTTVIFASVFLILFTIFRNLPWEPFVYLAPHELTP